MHLENLDYFSPSTNLLISMGKNRLEAFSDGVLAIIITIMVLEIKTPHSTEWSDLRELLPVFTAYVLSFTYVAIYWGNHHHLLHTAQKISAGIIWSNMNLLFWLSLVPFATGWMGENNFAQNTVVLYAAILMLCGFSYAIFQNTIHACHKSDLKMAQIYRAQFRKGLLSTGLYALAIGFAYVNTLISGIIFFGVATMWVIPDKNIERVLGNEE